MQVLPDWFETYTIKEAEKELTGFKYRGPGIYMHGADTVLVVEGENQRLTFYVYNTISVNTILQYLPNNLFPRHFEPDMKIGDATVSRLAEKLGIEEGESLRLLTQTSWNSEKAEALYNAR